MNNYTGLSTKEITCFGENIIVKKKKSTFISMIIGQLVNPMIIVLIVSAILSFIINLYLKEPITDVIIILSVVIINSFLGVIQEKKAEKAIDALSKLQSQKSKVYRDSKLMEIDSTNIVKNDIVLIESGDIIPADGILIENVNLTIDESKFTGESVGIIKNNNDELFMSSIVTYGKGIMKVTNIGMETSIGKIAHSINTSSNNETPLQIKLKKLSNLLTIIVLLICILMFFINILKSDIISIDLIMDSFMLAISLGVAAIPEGLAAVVTIILSIGVTNLAKENAIVRKMNVVETLGCVNVICSDKTGTITENKMCVEKSFSYDQASLCKAIFQANDAKFNENWIGEATEIALKEYALKNYFNLYEENRIKEIPFDSSKKYMSVLIKEKNKFIEYTKGAIDVIINKCSCYLKNGLKLPFSYKEKQFFLNINHEYSKSGLRVLGCCFKEFNSIPSLNQMEQDLCFIGLVGLIDPVRPNVKSSVKECNNASIQTIMITGDHIETACAIAKDIGIINSSVEAITGFELDKISDETLKKDIHNYKIFARVDPFHKNRIVKALQSNNLVVAMTGDGVNDAISIKQADIGISMGKNGTDVAKDASDIILADDNFETIVKAVKEGRKIYNNIDKAIHYLISSNLSEVICILFATIKGFTILNPAQILWINLITDSFPAVALGLDPIEEDIMNKPPRKKSKNIFSKKQWFIIIYQGILVSILSLISYLIGTNLEFGTFCFVNSQLGKSMAFVTMSIAELFHCFNVRTNLNSIFSIKKDNVYLLIFTIISLILTSSIVLIPSFASFFNFQVLSIHTLALSIILGLLIIPIVEIIKLLMRKYKKTNKNANH